MRARLYVAAVLAGVAAVAVLAFLILGPGRLDPSPPSLSANPVERIPGEILFIDPDGCVIRAQASGTAFEEITCPGTDTQGVTWVDEETIAYLEFGPAGPIATRMNLRTGETLVSEVVAPFPRQPADPVSVNGERVDVNPDGNIYVVRDSERTLLYEYDGPKYRTPSFVTWSPDGEWLLFHYEDELWIFSRDGSVRGTLAKTAEYNQTASWWMDGHGYLPELDDPDRSPGGIPTPQRQ